MFVGHYFPGLAIKAADKTIPLWLLFLAVQFVDILWAIFVLLGIEKVRITPGITEASPLDLYIMPYTHSLVAAAGWSLVGAIAARLIVGPRLTARGARWIGVAVFSHWLLDLIVHRPDLPILDNTWKLGFGLWNYAAAAFALEAGLLVVSLLLYLGSSSAITTGGKYAMPIFIALLIAVNAFNFYGPPPGSDRELALSALGSFLVFASIAYWLEKKRT